MSAMEKRLKITVEALVEQALAKKGMPILPKTPAAAGLQTVATPATNPLDNSGPDMAMLEVLTNTAIDKTNSSHMEAMEACHIKCNKIANSSNLGHQEPQE